ncbi:ClC family H(+)/Cl(-) exchange transporter, partial [Dickeya dadantii]|nr:ClC family H(+)/Cl(-) exchange transporter [Dickeya dadantii]
MPSSFSLPAAVRSAAIRQLVRRDKTPAYILVMAALTGTLVGLLGVGFNQAVNAVQHWRLALLSSQSG